MKFKKYLRSLLNEMPGQLSELDYRKNPQGITTQGASGVKHQGKHKVDDKQIKSASARKATGGVDAQGNDIIESDSLDTYRALIGKQFSSFVKNKNKIKNVKDLKKLIEYFAQKVYNFATIKTFKWKDENGQVQTIDIPEDKKSIFDEDTDKTYSIKDIAKILVETILSYEKKFKLITWEVDDDRWKDLKKKGILKDKVGWLAQTIDKLAPIGGIKRALTTRQEFGKGYILAIDNKSDVANNVLILWATEKHKDTNQSSTKEEFYSLLRTIHGDLKKEPKNRYGRESGQGVLPLKFEGMDADGFPIFGRPLLHKEVMTASNEKLLELTGHYEIIDLIEKWEDALKQEPNSDPRYLKYDIKRFYIRKSNPEPTARAVRVKDLKAPSFFK